MINKSLLIIILLLTFLIYSSSKSNDAVNPLDTNSNILNLDDSNLDNYIDQADYLLVYFYLTNNEQCNEFNHVYQQAYNSIVVAEKLNVTFARIDGMKNSEIIEKYEIEKYPSVIMFRKLGRDYGHFKGKKKTLDTFKTFIKSEVNPIVKWNEVISLSEFDAKGDQMNILLLFGDKAKFSSEMYIIKRAVDSLGDKYQLFITNSEQLKTRYGITSPDTLEILFFKRVNVKKQKKLRSEPYKVNLSLIDKFETNKLIRLFKSYVKRPFAKLNKKSIDVALAGNTNSLVLILSKEQNSTNSGLLNSIKNFAELNRASLWILIGYYDDDSLKDLMDVITVSKDELPCAIILSGVNPKTEYTLKYKYNLSERGKLDEINLIKFYEDWKANKLQYILLSEPIPKDAINQNGVHKIVTDSIDNFFRKAAYNKFSVVLFINQDMQNYQEITDRYLKIAEKLRQLNLVFGTINPYLNEVEIIMMKNYPGIALFSNTENKTDSFEYENPSFKTSNLLNFIKNYSNIDVFSKFNETEKLEMEKESELEMEKEKEEEQPDLSEYLNGIDIKQMLDESDQHGDDQDDKHDDKHDDKEDDKHDDEHEDENSFDDHKEDFKKTEL